LGTFLAPLLGGILYTKAGPEGVFGMGFAVIMVDLIMRALVIDKKVLKRYMTGSPRSSGGSSIVPDLQQEEEGALTHDPNSQPGEEAPLLGNKNDADSFKLPRDQSSIAKKIKILPCLRNPRLLTAFLVAFVQAVLLSAFDATVPTTAQELFGLDALHAGLLFIPLGACNLVIGPLAGWFVDRYGTKAGAVLGYTFLVPVLVALRLTHEGGRDQIILYGGLLALCGTGLAIVGSPSLVESGNIMRKYCEANPGFFGEQGPYAQLYGLNSLVFSLGLTMGPVLAGELKTQLGYGNMNVVLAGVSLATAALCMMWLGEKPGFLIRHAQGPLVD
jgi:Na+/melibiose symporter-like transporter